MPFLTQQNRNDCGAFCICYLNWLDRGRTPAGGPAADDQAMVDEIYNFVQFGDSTVETYPPDYCDVVRMMTLLQLLHEVSFYADPTAAIYSNIQSLHLDVGARDQAFMDILESRGKLHGAPPPDPQEWDGPAAAIAAYYAQNAQGNRGIHAVLFRRGPSGELFRYNPWDGMAVAVNGYEPFHSSGYDLIPAQSAIFIQ